MLDIPKRISQIQSLIDEDTDQSLTYAALECRLTLEHICYERFRLSHGYLSPTDLRRWQPRDVIKQVSEEVNEHVAQELTIFISASAPRENTVEGFQELEYTEVGTQAPIHLNKLHSYWHALSNVALHIPVPTIASGELSLYGNRSEIKNKVEDVLKLLPSMESTLLSGGHLGKTFSFKCQTCETEIRKPEKFLVSTSVASCISPDCYESYLISAEKNGERAVTRRTFDFPCDGCDNILQVPVNAFSALRFQQQLNVKCCKCQGVKEVFMRPVVKI